MATETVTSTTRAAPFIEAAGKTYLDDLQKAVGGLKTADLSKVYGPQFQAGLGALTQDAIGKASGLGSFQPFLQTAAGLAPKTGAELQSLVQGFKSPYQQDVIDATLSEFDVQAAKGIPNIQAQAVSRGVLGGGREGVQLAEYQSASDRNRAALLAQLNQQGFGQAQDAASNAFTQTQQLGADQQRMATLVPSLYGSDISTLGQAGRGQQLYEQSVLDQQREANRLAAYEPYERLGYMGAGMGNVMGGAMGQYTSQVTPNQSPLQQALGIASLGLGAYKAFNPPGS